MVKAEGKSPAKHISVKVCEMSFILLLFDLLHLCLDDICLSFDIFDIYPNSFHTRMMLGFYCTILSKNEK